MVSAQRFQRLVHRLSEVLGERAADTDVVAVFHENFGQRERQTVDIVGVTLDEQLTACVISDRVRIRHERSGRHTVQHRLFMVGASDTIAFRENLLVLVGPLVVDAVEGLVEDRLDNRAKIRTAHRGCHLSALLRSNSLQ